MSEFNETMEEELEITDSLTMEVTGTFVSFASVEWADRYFSELLDGQLWEVTNLDRRKKALTQATRAINMLRFSGEKTDDAQPLEFPRNGDETLPECLMQATAEEAFALLKGVDVDTELRNIGVIARVFGKVRTDYSGRVAQPNVLAGIASPKAWRFLQPLLGQELGIKLCRRS